jgi:signal transduction histidine kinase
MEQPENFQKDLERIWQIPIVSTLLDVVCETTGMGFAAIARVTETTWMACAVRDDIGFGLKPGGELQINTTICNEIMHSGKSVIIDHVKKDLMYKDHHTPALYGFQSYISVPIMRKDGTFFGTLCAIDPDPRLVNTPAIIGMFKLFVDLIAFHLDALEHIQSVESKFRNERAFNEELERKIQERTLELEKNNAALLKMNDNLQTFTYISSHDLQEPLRKIQTFISVISSKEENLSEKGRNYFGRIQSAASRMQVLINDLLSYSHTEVDEKKFERLHLQELVDDVKDELREELQQQHATIEVHEMCEAQIISVQFRQLLQNLIANALKFASPDRLPHICIESRIVDATEIPEEHPPASDKYCHIRVADNGIGFDQKYEEKIFELFKRLHNDSEYTGTGIGLAIVKKIVENHNGVIRAEGNPGKGAAFDIYIPAA